MTGQSKIAIATVVILGIIIVVAWPQIRTDRESSVGANAPAVGAVTPRLALISSSCNESYGYDECNGFVRNLTNTSMSSVEAVIIWLDASGTPQKSESALIDFDPLLSNQQSPWKVIGKHNPELTRYKVVFKTFGGSTIALRDDR